MESFVGEISKDAVRRQSVVQASSTARQASSTNIMAGRRGSSIVLQRKESTARAAGMDQSFVRLLHIITLCPHRLIDWIYLS